MSEYKDSYSDSGSQDEALKLFQEAYQKQNDGNLDEAIQLYHKSLALFPSAEAHTFLGWALSLKGLFDDAIEECHKAIAIDPDFGNPYNDIGAYLIEKGKHDAAIEWLEKATVAKRYDSYFYPYYNLGRVWEKKGDWGRAADSYRSALNSNPDYTLARKALNRLQAMMN